MQTCEDCGYRSDDDASRCDRCGGELASDEGDEGGEDVDEEWLEPVAFIFPDPGLAHRVLNLLRDAGLEPEFGQNANGHPALKVTPADMSQSVLFGQVKELLADLARLLRELERLS